MFRTDKFFYYTKNILRQAIPAAWFEMQFKRKMAAVRFYDKSLLNHRVDYYNKLNSFSETGTDATVLKNMDMFKSPKAYNFDTYDHTRYFNKGLKANFLFGDIIHTPPVPSIQKKQAGCQ